MQDTYVEYMVKRKLTARDNLCKAAYVVAGLIVFFVCFLFSGYLGMFGFLAILAGMAAVAGAFWLISRVNVEFECTLTNGEFDVDAIYAKKTRKRLLNFHCKDVESLSLHDGKKPNAASIVDACSSPADPGVWCAVVKHSQKGKVALLFNANDQFLAAMKPFLPGLVSREAFKNISFKKEQ